MQRRSALVLLTSAAAGGADVLQPKAQAQSQNSPQHVGWVAEVMKRMETVKAEQWASQIRTPAARLFAQTARTSSPRFRAHTWRGVLWINRFRGPRPFRGPPEHH